LGMHNDIAMAEKRERLQREKAKEEERAQEITKKIRIRRLSHNRETAIKVANNFGTKNKPSLAALKGQPMTDSGSNLGFKGRFSKAVRRKEMEAWEKKTEAGVNYWHNRITGAFTDKDPFPEPEVQEPLGTLHEGEVDAFAFLDNWQKYSNIESLPAVAPSSDDWYGEAPEYQIERHN